MNNKDADETAWMHKFYFSSFQISLEFYQRKRARWPFPAECIPWEVWTIKLDIISLSNEHRKLLLITSSDSDNMSPNMRNSEYDQEIPQSQIADKPMAPQGRAHNHHETPGRQTKQSNQLSLPHQNNCKTRMDIE